MINSNNLLDFINQDSNNECHNIIFNILKNYNIPYTQNQNGIFINMENLNKEIKSYIINYINNYYKIKYMNNKINLQNKTDKDKYNIDMSITIPINNEEFAKIIEFKSELSKSKYKKYTKNILVKKKYNCKLLPNELFLNNLKSEEVLI